MAKYIMLPDNRGITYSLDECEDYLVIDAYLHIKRSAVCDPRDLKLLDNFEYYHLGEGGTLNDTTLLRFNYRLIRSNKPGLHFVNGHTTNYAILRGQDKIKRRQAIVEHLMTLSEDERVALIRQKHLDAASLPRRDIKPQTSHIPDLSIQDTLQPEYLSHPLAEQVNPDPPPASNPQPLEKLCALLTQEVIAELHRRITLIHDKLDTLSGLVPMLTKSNKPAKAKPLTRPKLAPRKATKSRAANKRAVVKSPRKTK